MGKKELEKRARTFALRSGGEMMRVTGISLEIPAEILGAAKLPPKEVEYEFRKELALALYQRGVLPLGKARLLAQMTRWEFEELLGKRRILRHYTNRDLEEDVQYGLGRQ
ncbi:MAG: UPF0175 family protein [Anaerolineae bacterium]